MTIVDNFNPVCSHTLLRVISILDLSVLEMKGCKTSEDLKAYRDMYLLTYFDNFSEAHIVHIECGRTGHGEPEQTASLCRWEII